MPVCDSVSPEDRDRLGACPTIWSAGQWMLAMRPKEAVDMEFTDEQIRALLRDPARHPPSARHLGFELIDFLHQRVGKAHEIGDFAVDQRQLRSQYRIILKLGQIAEQRVQCIQNILE